MRTRGMMCGISEEECFSVEVSATTIIRRPRQARWQGLREASPLFKASGDSHVCHVLAATF